MKKYLIIHGSAADALHEDYESILSDAATELSEAEYEHLADIANIGFEYAMQKDEYIEALQDIVFGWLAEARRADIHLIQASTEIDFINWYNEPIEVKKQMKVNQGFHVIPTFFVYFGAVVLSLFCIFATIFVIGIFQKTFPVNPVYLFMFTVGFLGLLLTDIVAIAEWRKGQNVQGQRNS